MRRRRENNRNEKEEEEEERRDNNGNEEGRAGGKTIEMRRRKCRCREVHLGSMQGRCGGGKVEIKNNNKVKLNQLWSTISKILCVLKRANLPWLSLI